VLLSQKNGRDEFKKNAKFSTNSINDHLQRWASPDFGRTKPGREEKCAFQRHVKKTPYSKRTTREEIFVPQFEFA